MGYTLASMQCLTRGSTGAGSQYAQTYSGSQQEYLGNNHIVNNNNSNISSGNSDNNDD